MDTLTKTEQRILASYRRLSAARYVMSGTNNPVCACRLCRVDIDKLVTVNSDGQGHAYYGALQHCKKVWLCSICSLNISRNRRALMAELVKRERTAGHGAALLTYTLSHKRYDTLRRALAALTAAHKALHSGKGWQKIAKSAGWLGSIRAIEITYTINGWHPHIHEIAFFETDTTPDNRKAALAPLIDRWINSLVAQGASATKTRGLDIKPAYGSVTDYVGKWGIVPELVNGAHKSGYGASIVPFQLLDVIAANPDQSIREQNLFFEYQQATHGLHQLHPSPQYRAAMVESDEPKTDSSEDIALASMNGEQWQAVWERGLRGELLIAARAGVLDAFMIKHGLSRS